jgi:hypothetical protein
MAETRHPTLMKAIWKNLFAKWIFSAGPLGAHHPIKPISASGSQDETQTQSMAPKVIRVWFDAWRGGYTGGIRYPVDVHR